MSEAPRLLPPVETNHARRRHLPTTDPIGRVQGEEPQALDMAVLVSPPSKKRLPVEPIETTTRGSQASVRPAPELTPEPSPRSPPPASDRAKPRRRFTPQLIETTRRSKKAGDSMPATLPTDKTDITPGTNHIYVPRRKQKPRAENALSTQGNTNLAVPQIRQLLPYPPRRQCSMKPHLNTRRSTRRDSYQSGIDIVMTDENSREINGDQGCYYDDEDTPSLTASFGSSGDSIMRLQLARTRESCDERFSGYLLELAAKAAEKQLQEQALAAFPNSDFHEVVEHFYDREIEGSSDDDSIVGVGLLPHEMLGDLSSSRRKSTEVGWVTPEIQMHQERLVRLREEETHRLLAAEATNPTFNDPFWTNGMTVKAASFIDRENEAELDRMRSAANPPMLGGDLIFRICPSPKATKFETDQRINITPNRKDDGGGLWGGYCVADEEAQPLIRGPHLLETPANEWEDPFPNSPIHENPSKSRLTSSPGKKGGVHLLAGIDERLRAEAADSKLEEAILKDFDDKFVTQVYNYLSLGYPSLARQYDEELSKITHVPQEELCKDDQQADVTGHITHENGGTNGVRCARWTALRLYILEWARQHPSLSDEELPPSAWGVRARRGSWAI
jgi:hypothetical protein